MLYKLKYSRCTVCMILYSEHICSRVLVSASVGKYVPSLVTHWTQEQRQDRWTHEHEDTSMTAISAGRHGNTCCQFHTLICTDLIGQKIVCGGRHIHRSSIKTLTHSTLSHPQLLVIHQEYRERLLQELSINLVYKCPKHS